MDGRIAPLHVNALLLLALPATPRSFATPDMQQISWAKGKNRGNSWAYEAWVGDAQVLAWPRLSQEAGYFNTI